MQFSCYKWVPLITQTADVGKDKNEKQLCNFPLQAYQEENNKIKRYVTCKQMLNVFESLPIQATLKPLCPDCK
jgi:hypothetical protein